LRYLETSGVLDEDDVETIREEKRKTSRENQVATFIDVMKRREHGFRHFLQALLKSKVQDFLARELLEDDVYDEEEISTILAELENDLDETQSLKLRLIEEEKRHKNTKKELEEIRRSSIIFSDSSSSGLFADYDSDPSDENEFANYSPQEEMDNEASRDDNNSVLIDQTQCGSVQTSDSLLARNEDLEWEHEDGWRKFGSVDHLDTLCLKRVKQWGSLEKLQKSASLGRLNETGQRRSKFAKCSSGESLKQRNESFNSLNRRKKEKRQAESLEDRVSLLEKQLQDEKRRREKSENEVAKLQLEKEDLHVELEDVRDQLRESQMNLYYEEDDYEEELCFEQGGDDNDSRGFCRMTDEMATAERKTQYPLTADSEITAARCGSPGVNKLRSQTEQLRRTRLTGSWRSVNAQFYELDEYDNEIKVELDPSNILDTLRRLKTYTNSLYNDVLIERDELRYLKNRVTKLESR